MNQCTTESRNQWINVINWFHESTKQWISESLSQWINEWTLQQFRFKSSVNQVNQWVDESRNQRIDESMNQCFNDSMNQWITESMNAATNESMNEEIWPISSSKIAPIPQFFANFKWNWRILYEIDLPRQNCAHFASFIVQQCSDPFSFFFAFFSVQIKFSEMHMLLSLYNLVHILPHIPRVFRSHSVFNDFYVQTELSLKSFLPPSSSISAARPSVFNMLKCKSSSPQSCALFESFCPQLPQIKAHSPRDSDPTAVTTEATKKH